MLPSISFVDSRDTFINTFLSEMPKGTPATDFSYQIQHDIREWQNYIPIIKLSDTLFKMEGEKVLYYWYEVNGKILLGAEFRKDGDALVVSYIGKPNRGGAPYASDLYLAVLNDRKNIPGNVNAIVMSDSMLSDEGFNIWSRLLKDGHKLLIYNSEQPGSSYIKINSFQDLQNYFKHGDKAYEKYRYVLSENNPAFGEILAFFSLRRLRETSGML